MKLYELTDNYMQLVELADQLDEETFRNTLESIQDSIEDKIENTAKVIKSIEADVQAIKEEEKRLKERRQALEKKIDNIKDYLKEQLEKAGIDKVKRATFTVSIQNNPPKAEILDEKSLPLEFMIPQPAKVDKRAILEKLKSGEHVPGAALVQERGLRIK
jgi:predicted nuclease with TOPRIM domain